jgi:hypothetical protein
MAGKPRIDLKGQTFGELTVLELDPNPASVHRQWLCLCSCGNTVSHRQDMLRQGRRKSCGCKARQTHGLFKSHRTEYHCWRRLKRIKDIPDYWVNDFAEFVNDIGSKPSDNHRLGKRDYREPHGKKNTYWRRIDATGQQHGSAN